METEKERWSILASTAHPQEDLQLSASDREAAEAVAEALRDAKAANTRRVYGSAWHDFCVWALESGRESLPADPRTVALYLGRLTARPWPPSPWPAPQYPRPPRGQPRPTTRHAIPSWPK